MPPERLETRWLGRPWRHLGECGSTNDEAAAWARDAIAPAPHGAVVTADAQSRGRGRLGRSWHSPPGENLYFSLVLRPPIEPRELPPLVLAVGVALADTVAARGVAVDLKWPNDVLARGRKLAGILAELACSGSRIDHVVVGIGVDLETRAFPPPLDAIATSIALETGRDLDRGAHADGRDAFAADLAAALETWYERFVSDGAAPILAAWRARSGMLGREVTVRAAGPGGDDVRGVAEDLDADGALLVRTAEGVTRVVAGELAIV